MARLGGDEFAVLATGLEDADDALVVARKLRQAVEWPFTLRGLTLEVEASIGIAIFPEHGTDADTLLRHADVAMYQSKEAHSRPRALLPGARRVLARPAQAARRAAPGDRARTSSSSTTSPRSA